jgi:hypothetical protein
VLILSKILLAVFTYLLLTYEITALSLFIFTSRSIAKYSDHKLWSYFDVWPTIFLHPHRWRDILLYSLILRAASKTYFCGYPLPAVIDRKLFEQLAKANDDCGFCYELSALTLLMLRTLKSAKLVQGFDGEKHFKHAWVELRFLGQDYVIDLAWNLVLFPFPKKYIYKKDHLESRWECPYTDFWAIPATQRFAELLSAAETSYIFSELSGYRPENTANHVSVFGFRSHPSWNLSLNSPNLGHTFQDYNYVITITKPLIDGLMTDAEKTPPNSSLAS